MAVHSMSQLIARTAASGAPKALVAKLERAMHTRVLGSPATGSGVPAQKEEGAASSPSGLGDGVAKVMIAQRKDRLKDAALGRVAKAEREVADEKVKSFAAKERAKELARHARWEAEAEEERKRLAAKRAEKEAAHQQLLHAAHVKQQTQTKALQAVERRDEQQLKALEARRATLMAGSAQGGGDATVLNAGARMTSLFEGKEKLHQLRQQFKGLELVCVCACVCPTV